MRLIDADALEYKMLYKENWLKGTGYEAQAIWKKDIDSQPTIDAVPVVRCRDCIKWGTMFCIVTMDGGKTTKHFYCADGKRKDGADNG